jgi:PAS domain S-box-containing protein
MLLDMIPAGMFYADVRGSWCYVNRQCCDLIGISSDVALGRGWMRAIHSDDLARVKSEWGMLVSDRKPFCSEFRFVKPDNTVVWVLCKVNPVNMADDSARAFVGLMQDISDRKRIEEVIRENEQRYYMLAENATDIIWTASLDCRMTYISPSITRVLGYTQEEAIELGPLGALTESSIPTALEYLAKIQALVNEGQHQADFTIEVELIKKDGSKIWGEIRLTLFVNADGQVEALGVTRDITARKMATRDLEIEKDRLAVTLASIGDAVIAVDLEEKVVLFNPIAENLTGWTADEAIGKPFNEIFNAFSEVTHEKLDCPVRKVLQTGLPLSLVNHTALISRDGSTRSIADSCAPIRDTSGNMTGVVLVFRDVTEHKQAEKALQESEKKYSTIVENGYDGIAIIQDGLLVFANSTIAGVIGINPEETIGQPFTNFIALQDRERLVEIYQKRMQGLKLPANLEFEALRKDGKTVPVEAHSVLIEYQGRMADMMIIRDITERKQAEKEKINIDVQLRHAQKLESIGQLAAGIAHEINTPTQYVGDNTNFIRDGFKSLSKLIDKYTELINIAKSESILPDLVREIEELAQEEDIDYLLEEIPKAVSESLTGIERITKIVRAMKEFSHPGANEKTATNINKAIETTVTVARNEWKYVSEMQLDLDPDLPDIPCLPGDFNQVILNMIINAAHAIADVVGDGSNGKGLITITTKADDDSAEIRISDTGSGIPESARPKIFDPFFTTKEVGKGTGQGLAISHSVIVEKHGGTISFDTDTGKGTTFIIRLPMNRGSISVKAA